MAKERRWKSLAHTETETLTTLVKSGVEVFAAPNDTELKEQFESLGITWAGCKTQRIGSEKWIVHLTPAGKATYDMLLHNLHTNCFKKGIVALSHRCLFLVFSVAK